MTTAVDELLLQQGLGPPVRGLEALTEDVSLDKFILDVVKDGVPDIDVASAVIDGTVNRTIEGASTVEMVVHDGGREILKSGIFSSEKGTLRTIDAELDDIWFQLASVRKSGNDLRLVFEDRNIAWLRQHKGPRKASRAKMTRAQFVLSLVQTGRLRAVPFVVPDLTKKQPIGKARKAERKQVRDSKREQGFPDGVELKGKEAQKLSKSQLANATKVLIAAAAARAGEKATLALLEACLQEAPDFKNPAGGDGTSSGILQVTAETARGAGIDPRNIEEVATYFLTKGFYGNGGAIQVARENPDYTPGEIAQAVQGSGFPKRYDALEAEAKSMLSAWGGVSTVSYHKRYEYKIDKDQDYWDGIQDLANEVNWRAFFVSGTFYYISEEVLIKSRPIMTISEDSPGISNIDFDWDRGKPANKATVECRISRWAAPPGSVVALEGLGPADDRWLVESIRRPLFSAEGQIQLRQPRGEKVEPRAQLSSRSVVPDKGVVSRDGGARGMVDQIADFVIENNKDLYVGSSLRKGSTTSSGNTSDHSQNNERMAARDIGKKDVDLIKGPPSSELDSAAAQIGQMFDRDYGDGSNRIVDTFHWKGYRVQVIWRTPEYGGHMGHVHVGIRKD